MFRYEDQAGLTAFIENRLGVKVALRRENVLPEMPLALSAGVEKRLRRKCRVEFDLYDSIGPAGRRTGVSATGG